MPPPKFTMLQICITCFLVSMLGLETIWRYPEWFYRTASERFITLGSATSVEDSGFLDYTLPIFQAATGLDVHVKAIGTGRALAEGAHGDVDSYLSMTGRLRTNLLPSVV